MASSAPFCLSAASGPGCCGPHHERQYRGDGDLADGGGGGDAGAGATSVGGGRSGWRPGGPQEPAEPPGGPAAPAAPQQHVQRQPERSSSVLTSEYQPAFGPGHDDVAVLSVLLLGQFLMRSSDYLIALTDPVGAENSVTS
jgi:hypothetical protein